MTANDAPPVIQRVNLPLPIANMLYECSGRSEDHMLLCNTFLYEKDGEEDLCISTDSARLYVANASPHSLFPIEPGIYRWIQKPKRDLQLVERLEGQYPNWRRPFPDAPQPFVGTLSICGRLFNWNVRSGVHVNIGIIPKIESSWDIRQKANSPLAPLHLVGELGQLLIMPMADEAPNPSREEFKCYGKKGQ